MRKDFTYQIVEVSPWPITSSISVMSILIGNVLIFDNVRHGKEILIGSIISLIYSAYRWFKDIVIEGTYQGEHTNKVQKGLMMGFVLFVVSEVAVFLSLIFSYFYNTFIPSVEVGGIWPPTGIIEIDYKAVPLLNTILLLSSGFTITACHNYLIFKDKSKSLFYLISTILLGGLFLFFQFLEYFSSPFTLSDSVYGSSFYILTSAHGLHIIIGVAMLTITLLRFHHFTNLHHLLFSSSAIYWHFLDAVWLFLYFSLYCWTL
jgi:cytochrome c oxidase subunit 3